jgi:TRAP-type C4-dicarboxylate transport system permease small subunit
MAVILRKVRQILLIAVGCFFLLFGVHLLISAYELNNPFWFVMTFFASNLIILISVALVIGFVIRLIKPLEKGEDAVSTRKGREG